MSDKEARVFGAGDSVEVNGRTYRLMPIGMRMLHDVQRAALRHFKREYLQTFSDGLAIMPGDYQAAMMAKINEVARWDINELPKKISYDVSGVTINEAMVARLAAAFDLTAEDTLISEPTFHPMLLATALDSGEVLPDEVQQITGGKPRRYRTPYDVWWVTAVRDGMVTFVLASLAKSHPEVTKEDVEGWPPVKIAEAARTVERITAPALGNT